MIASVFLVIMTGTYLVGVLYFVAWGLDHADPSHPTDVICEGRVWVARLAVRCVIHSIQSYHFYFILTLSLSLSLSVVPPLVIIPG